ncbi:MAG: flagellar biosynthetic protein FliP, partial [Rhodobacteraceae bacterium]|nr:flagellar biosynthetic protein FliP [Paracoccaceae bacterium]
MALGLAGALALAMALAPDVAAAQEISLSLGDEGSFTATGIRLLVLVTVLSLVPGLAVTITAFPFIVTVLAILRQAIGLQQSPPNMLIVSLALFLTWFVMDPVLTAAWSDGIQPL